MTLRVARVAQEQAPCLPSDASCDSDTELVRACLDGDRAAFDRLYRRHAAQVHRRLARMVGGDSELEDLVQQVFLEAFRSLSGFRQEASFSTWLYRVSANVALSALRRRQRRRPVWQPADEFDEVEGCEATPEEKVRERELCRIVLDHLGALKPEQRIAFVLRHVECLELEEISAIVGARTPAVRQRIKVAERKLCDRIARAEMRADRILGGKP